MVRIAKGPPVESGLPFLIARSDVSAVFALRNALNACVTEIEERGGSITERRLRVRRIVHHLLAQVQHDGWVKSTGYLVPFDDLLTVQVPCRLSAAQARTYLSDALRQLRPDQ